MIIGSKSLTGSAESFSCPHCNAVAHHPATMEVFYTKWTSGMPLFQRTRGVLRSFAVALRDAEQWDTAPLAGASILLAKPGEEKLSPALSDLAGAARVDQVDGLSQDWVAAELQKQLDQRLLSRYWVDTASGVELIMTHRGANIAYLARATGLICGFMLPAQNCFITAPQWE
jgi:hypothetical protein